MFPRSIRRIGDPLAFRGSPSMNDMSPLKTFLLEREHRTRKDSLAYLVWQIRSNPEIDPRVQLACLTKIIAWICNPLFAPISRKISTPLFPIILMAMGPRAARHLVTRTLARIPPLFIAILLMVPSFARKTIKPFNLLMWTPKSGLQKKWQTRKSLPDLK